jgi:fido (protein-threonine AMPylation protein)
MTDKEHMDFDDYLRQDEPDKQEKAYIWRTAIGLQAVDGLETSDYLKETARKHIEGVIDIDEARDLIGSYYQSKTHREPDDEEKREADKVSANIAKILSTRTIDFTTHGYIAVHRRLFEGVFKHAGKLRDYDIAKKEWVLKGDSIAYLNWEDLMRAIDYEIEQERSFSYNGLSPDEIVCHITRFVSGLWQVHPFREGNTRTTAVFTIQYLRSIGFDINNDLFARHSWYFRNALVRANYKNARLGIDYNPIYLERFFRNLLFNEHWDLRNRYLHIQPDEEWANQPVLDQTQAMTKHPTGTQQVPNKLVIEDANVNNLVRIIGNNQLSVKQMLKALNLKDRVNFLYLYLNPAITDGYVTQLYPNSLHHPRQKYLLTVKGLAAFQTLSKK